ncbi:MAG: radical SAM protein [Flavobacteriales bacterium]|nr:radical SAM protein [Flavobacteriales bacterium]
MDKLKIARLEKNGGPEIFRSIQGEGPHAGQERTFVRLSLCNLHCVWCDTPYTWNWQQTNFRHDDDEKFRREEQIIELSPEEVAEIIRELGCNKIVITGGEPMLQQAVLVPFMALLRDVDPDCFFEVETNGTILPEPAFDTLVNHYNVSPKMTGAGMTEKQRIRPEVLNVFSTSPKAIFKFVVRDEEDLREVERFTARFITDPSDVFLMAKGRTVEQLDMMEPRVQQWAEDRKWGFSPRLHVRMFGDKRGV